MKKARIWCVFGSCTKFSSKSLATPDNYYTITVTYRNNKAKADYTVVLKDKNGNEVKGTTDKNGIVTLPGKTHSAYIFGYDDGTFKGDNAITRAEVVTVVNRATNRNADTNYITKNYTKLNRFTDVTDGSMWYFFDIAESANTHKGITNGNSEIWVK